MQVNESSPTPAVAAAVKALGAWAAVAGPKGTKLAADIALRALADRLEVGAKPSIMWRWQCVDMLREMARAFEGAGKMLDAAADLLDGDAFDVDDVADALRRVVP